MELLHKDRTEQLIRGFFIVQNEVGLGRDEEAYQRAFEIWAEEQNLTVFSKPASPLTIEGHEVCMLYPDFVAWHDLIIELKALPRKLGPSEECFVIEDRFALTLTVHFDSDEFVKSLGLSHLKALDLPWGIAANFGRTDLQITALRHRQH